MKQTLVQNETCSQQIASGRFAVDIRNICEIKLSTTAGISFDFKPDTTPKSCCIAARFDKPPFYDTEPDAENRPPPIKIYKMYLDL